MSGQCDLCAALGRSSLVICDKCLDNSNAAHRRKALEEAARVLDVRALKAGRRLADKYRDGIEAIRALGAKVAPKCTCAGSVIGPYRVHTKDCALFEELCHD